MRGVRAAAGVGLVERQARLPVPPRVLQRRRPDPARPKNIYVREDRILPHLAALAILSADATAPDRKRQGGITAPARVADLIDNLRTTRAVLTYDPRTRTVRAGNDIVVAITADRSS